MKKLLWIDSLRGGASLAVVLLHIWSTVKETFKAQYSESLTKWVSFFVFDFFDIGKIGVVIFFIVSGYIIPISLKSKSVRAFGISRFFRLYPAYWLSILLSWVIIGMEPISKLLINLTMLQGFVGVENIIGVFWTLQIELVFYFLCVLLHSRGLLFDDYYLGRVFYTLLLLSLAVSVFRYSLDIKLPVALFLGLTLMFMGLIFRRYKVDNSETFTKRAVTKVVVAFILTLIPICLFAYSRDYGYDEKWYRYFVSYTVAIGIFGAFWIYEINFKWLNFGGKISYSLYLLHPVVGIAFGEIIAQYFGVENSIYKVCLFLLLSISSAIGAYYVVEKPSINLGRKKYLTNVISNI